MERLTRHKLKANVMQQKWNGQVCLILIALSACGTVMPAETNQTPQDSPTSSVTIVAPTSGRVQLPLDKSTTVAVTNTDVNDNSVRLTPQQQAAEATVRRYIDAVNRGDASAVAAVFAANARFDRAGSIFDGRDAIMENFLQPDVLDRNGRYEVLSVQHSLNAVTFEFTFQAGSLREHFTYRCTVRDDQIQDVVGRYVS